MHEGDEWKVAFCTNQALFEPLVMFFGLTNSPATFQTMMNHLFKDFVTEGVVAVYMDHILVFTETLSQHYEIVQRVLQILWENHLFLKAEKCTFGATTVEYLGLILSLGKVGLDPVKEVQSFLGFVNFHQHFIENFSHIAHPLHQLTQKDESWKWTEDHQRAFDQLKEAITSTPILVHPDAD
jgi:Reverse transcriptase (RNA-dependent DNA polymerase)